MFHTTAGRLTALTVALGGVLVGGALLAGPAFAEATPDPQPVQLSLKPLNQPGSYFDLTLEPSQEEELQVEIGNHGSQAIAARTYAADVFSIINGGFGAKDRDSEPSRTTTWLTYPPDVLELAPDQANVRPFTITVPADTAPGQYITSLIVENDVPVEGSGSVALNQVIRQAVAVSIRVPGALEPGFKFGSASHKISAKHSVVGVDIINTGNANLKPAGEMTIRDGAGKEVSHAPITMGSVYAQDSTRVETTLASTLAPGDYTVDITLTDAATHATSTGTALPFTVTAAEVEKARTSDPGTLPEISQDNDPGLTPYLIGAAVLALLAVLFFVFRRKPRPATPPEPGGRRTARRSSTGGATRRH